MIRKDRPKILVVDDLRDNLDLICEVLEDEPYEVFTALKSNTALEIARDNQLDLAILDVQMPELDGYGLCRKLRDMPNVSRMPIIFLTAHRTAAADAVKGLNLGASDYITKPLNPAELKARIRSMLRLHSEHRDAEESLGRSVSNLQNDLQLSETAQKSLAATATKNLAAIDELQSTKNQLERKNARLAELYSTAHQFVDNVSHEFRTPLTVIREFASIIRDGLAGTVAAEQREYLGIIIGRVDDLSLMVDDMLDISKLEAGLLRTARRECSAHEIISAVSPVLERKAAGWKITLEFTLDPKLPRIYCDPEKIGRVLLNLGVNALKFCGENGRVRIGVAADPAESQLIFRVADNGPGISSENLQPIFERFRQLDGSPRASTKGFGLGLSIAKELVHLNLGEIMVESEPGRGSTFLFTVPTSKPVAIVERFLTRLAATRASSTRLTILTCVTDVTIERDAGNEIDRFLQNQMSGGDLLFRVRPNAWLVVATIDGSDTHAAFRRLEKARVEAGGQTSAVVLADMDLREQGSWPADEPRLVERFDSAYRALASVDDEAGARKCVLEAQLS